MKIITRRTNAYKNFILISEIIDTHGNKRVACFMMEHTHKNLVICDRKNNPVKQDIYNLLDMKLLRHPKQTLEMVEKRFR